MEKDLLFMTRRDSYYWDAKKEEMTRSLNPYTSLLGKGVGALLISSLLLLFGLSGLHFLLRRISFFESYFGLVIFMWLGLGLVFFTQVCYRRVTSKWKKDLTLENRAVVTLDGETEKMARTESRKQIRYLTVTRHICGGCAILLFLISLLDFQLLHYMVSMISLHIFLTIRDWFYVKAWSENVIDYENYCDLHREVKERA